MKLSYECWRRQLRMQDLFYTALKETLSEMRLLALYKLQRMVAKIAPADEADDSESNVDAEREELGIYRGGKRCQSRLVVAKTM